MILPNPKGQMPNIDPSAFVAPTAVIIGDVTIGPEANIWFGAVIRGDWGNIKVGARTSIQENAVLHIEAGTNLEIGEDCIVGHGAIIHGAGKVGNKCLIGIGAIVMQGTTIGDGTIVAGGAVVRGDIKGKVMVAGVPAEVKKELTDVNLRSNVQNANVYVNNGKQFKKMLADLPEPPT
jgi:carbonic anhydrase/acetyltransferase-like protein (isoleucine patch superfamily)